MNLHGIAGPIVAAINPWLRVEADISIGYEIAPGGKQIPQYKRFRDIRLQWQSLTNSDVKQLQGLNISTDCRAAYVDGKFDGVVRPLSRGGDLIYLPDNSVWLVSHTLEDWFTTAGWVKIALTRQNQKAR